MNSKIQLDNGSETAGWVFFFQMPQLLFKHHCHFLPCVITKFIILVQVCVCILLSWGPGLLMHGEHGSKTCSTGQQSAGLTQTNMCIPRGDLGPRIHLICIFELLSTQRKGKQAKNKHTQCHTPSMPENMVMSLEHRRLIETQALIIYIVPRSQDMSW